MAVMTSISPDTFANEHKTQPVPSSDKMALDLDINGTSNHDEPSRDLAAPNPSIISSFELSSKSAAEVANGIQNENANAFETNNNVIDPLDAEINNVEESAHEEDLFPCEDVVIDASETLTTVPSTSTTQNNSVETTSQPQPQSEEQLDAITEPLLTTSSIPPVIEAQESDMREEISPATQEEAAEVKAEKHDLDLIADSSLAVTSGDSSFNEQLDSLPEVPSFDSASDPAPQQSSLEQPLHPQSVSNIDLNQPSPSDLLEAMESTQEDINMMDAPSSPTKTARPREEDAEEEPSAKRTKTEGDATASEFAIPDVPASASVAQNGNAASEPGDELPPTPYQQKEILKVVRQQKNTVMGKNFKDAVISLWPTLASSYQEKISSPMDLLTIENRMKDGLYATLGDFKHDLNLIYNNCVIFNGLDHSVTKAADTVRSHILNRIPGPEPVKTEKKQRKSTPAAELPPRAAAARRPSRGSAAPTTSPIAPAPAETFALGPSGAPLIRRDSSKADGGRPKREIHPPKPRDLIYNARPKKKFAQELKFCNEVLAELRKQKYGQYNMPFLAPVDPVALSIPDYFKIIKTPMDLSTVGNKLESGEITSAKEFESDVRLIFKNCYKFNPKETAVHVMGKQLESLFDQEMSKKSQWLSDHPSPNNAASPYSATESEAEESEEEVEEPAVTNTASLQARLIEEQNKLIALLAQKNPDQAMVRLQQDFIAMVKTQVDASTKAAEKAKPKAKAKAPKKVAAPVKKKAEPAKKAYRVKNIGMPEKEQISVGIAQLEGRDMEAAIAILKKDIPTLNLDTEEELDIDQFSMNALSQLHDLIIKRVPSIVPARPESKSAPKPSKPKKNKPMSKTEQEAKIEKLKKLQDQFERPGSGTSDDAPMGSSRVIPTVEQDQSSGDESPSDSEED